MPSPREQPGPRSRRRQDTMPGGWLWIVVLLLLAVVLWITVGGSTTGTLEYSDFLKLVNNQKLSKHLAGHIAPNAVIVTADRRPASCGLFAP